MAAENISLEYLKKPWTIWLGSTPVTVYCEAKADTFVNYTYGFFTLFLQGGAWGVFGCAAVGLLFERRPLRVSEWAGALATIVLCGWVTYYLIHVVIGFDINPYRSTEAGSADNPRLWRQ